MAKYYRSKVFFVIGIICCFSVTWIIWLNMSTATSVSDPSFWKNINLLENEIPDDIQEKAKTINIASKTIKVEEIEVFYREAESSDISHTVTLLLLHGAAFSSKTWQDLNTIQLLAAMGYRTVAIDLPGYANSPNAKLDKLTFINKVVKTFNLIHPVVISPSISGLYSIPYVLKNWQEMGGYIPIAPVGTNLLENINISAKGSNEKLQRIPDVLKEFLQPPIPNLDKYKVPTMVVYGEKDRKRNSALLSLLPYSQTVEIPNGNHPAYLDNPPMWHKLLYNFLRHVEISIKI